MIPVSGVGVYRRLRVANLWVERYLPNCSLDTETLREEATMLGSTQRLLEMPFQGAPGSRFESWEMNRKIIRLTRQAGYGLETNFSAEICQGNFDHHGSWAMKRYKERLIQLGIDPASSLREAA
jgi:hypothetical protein